MFLKKVVIEQFEVQHILNFIKELPNDDSCKAYLAKIKWRNGFTCLKYGTTKGFTKSGYNYHCYECHHDESGTANTLFHKVKFGLQKAFCMAFGMSIRSKSISGIQTGKRFGIRQGTACYLMQKVRSAMKSGQKYPLEKLIHVDEFTVGEKKKPNREEVTIQKNKKAVIALELPDNSKVKRIYIKAFEDYSARSLTPIFEEHISTSPKIITDK